MESANKHSRSGLLGGRPRGRVRGEEPGAVAPGPGVEPRPGAAEVHLGGRTVTESFRIGGLGQSSAMNWSVPGELSIKGGARGAAAGCGFGPHRVIPHRLVGLLQLRGRREGGDGRNATFFPVGSETENLNVDGIEN